ncbi:MAG: adenylate kinase [Kiritimatiellales bacterium]
MKAIILLGGPGAGKGTLAEIIKKKSGFLHVSTGEILRAAIRNQTPVGLKVKVFIDRGELVPDEIVLEIIKELIAARPASARFMFDGFPRTVVQAEGLEQLFAENNGTLLHVFQLDLDHETLLRRLTGRRVCRSCGALFHIDNKPPQKEGLCDFDNGELYQRSDDSEETILNRLDVYEKQTAPLVGFYRQRGLLRKINASETPEQVTATVLSFLNRTFK